MTTQVFEESTVRPAPPRICLAANLPSFETERDGSQYFESIGGHEVTLAKWQCAACNGWHWWTGAPGDTNGGSLSGSREIPPRILDLILRTKL